VRTNDAGYVLIYDPRQNELFYINPVTEQRPGKRGLPLRLRARLRWFNAWLKLFYPVYAFLRRAGACLKI